MTFLQTKAMEIEPRPDAPPMPHRYYPWEVLALLFGTFFFHQADRAIYGVVLPAIRADLQLTDAQLGMVGTVLFATLASLLPITGYLGDIWSRKWIITISLMFWSLATMVTGRARGLVSLIMFRSVATAGGEAFYGPAGYSLIAQFHKKNRAMAMSIHQCAVYLGVIASGYVGGYIGERWGWRWTFFAFGGVGFLLGLVLCFRLKNTPRDETPADGGPVRPLQALGAIFRSRTAMLITLAFTGYVFVNNAYLVWAPAFLGQKFNLSLAVAGGHSMLYYYLSATIGVLIGAKVSDARVKVRHQFRLEFQAIALLLGIPAILAMGLCDSLTGTLIAMAAAGFTGGIYSANIHAALFDTVAPQYRGSSVASMSTIAFLIGSTSPWLLGRCAMYFPSGMGLSYGIAALSLAYLTGVAALLFAARYTFGHDSIGER